MIFGSVDERIDTAVGEHQHHGEVVQPASEVDRMTEEVEKVSNLDRRPAGKKTAACIQSAT